MKRTLRQVSSIAVISAFFLENTTRVLAAGTSILMCNGKGIQTAIGCIIPDPSSLVSELITLGVGIGGGLAFLMILVGALQIQTSQGNPEKMNAGKEIVGSAISGLLLIIFSVFILKLIGVNILAIPGFG